MSLMDKILGSVTQVAGYRVQPYKPYTMIAAYGNRFMSPSMVNPLVGDGPAGTASIIKPRGNEQLAYASPMPVILSNGAAPARGNNTPVRG